MSTWKPPFSPSADELLYILCYGFPANGLVHIVASTIESRLNLNEPLVGMDGKLSPLSIGSVDHEDEEKRSSRVCGLEHPPKSRSRRSTKLSVAVLVTISIDSM